MTVAAHEVEERSRGYEEGTAWACDYAAADELRSFVESFGHEMDGTSGTSAFDGPYWEGFLEAAEEVLVSGEPPRCT